MAPQEVPQIDHAGQQLGQARGERRAPHAPVQQENGHIVQHAVGQAPGDDRQDGNAGIAVGLDEHLHVIGHDEAHRKGRQTLQIVDGVLVRDAFRAQQYGKRLQKQEHQHRNGQADTRQQYGVLGEQAVGLFPLSLSQIDGDDGAGAHGENDADGEQHIGERHRQIHRRHSVFAHALGHEQPIHNGIQAEHHQRGHRGGHEM